MLGAPPGEDGIWIDPTSAPSPQDPPLLPSSTALIDDRGNAYAHSPGQVLALITTNAGGGHVGVTLGLGPNLAVAAAIIASIRPVRP